jgi:hypothetical protein
MDYVQNYDSYIYSYILRLHNSLMLPLSLLDMNYWYIEWM